MTEIRATFFSECEELMEALTDGLTALAEGRQGKDTVNAVFRAVHSIKGGAGSFGFQALVEFAHRFESALDELRSGRLVANAPEMAVFLRSADHLADLIQGARDGSGDDISTDQSLMAELEKRATPASTTRDMDEPAFEPLALLPDFLEFEPDQNCSPIRYVIRFAPYPDLFASGNDPLFILTALAELGRIEVRCQCDAVPELEDLDPQHCYFAWDITLVSTHSRDDVCDAAAFVEGLCDFDVRSQPFSVWPDEAGGGPATPHDKGAIPDRVAGPSVESQEPAVCAHYAVSAHPGNTPCKPEEGLAAVGSSDGGGPQETLPGFGTERASTFAIPGDRPENTAGSEQGTTVRVDLNRIDRLMNLVGELVINQSVLSQEISASGVARNSAVAIGLEEFLNLSRSIQESVMMIRAQPIKPLFSRMARILRETAAATGKAVRLRTEGENTEIDKTLVERLADPLTHMIRNAIDHGLEHAEQRAAAGKSPEGSVTLSASHRSGRVVIEVSDDGAGIDRGRVLAAAINRGLVPADQIMADADIDSLLFVPGLSTASVVSNLSGRGVGMDVVRSAIQTIGGRISIFSERGKGTRFTISLPLTLAVLDGMVVQITNERIVVPLSAIAETLTLNQRHISDIGNGRRIVMIRDMIVPLLDLGVELGYRFAPTNDPNAVILLLSQDDGNHTAIIVDRIEEQRQVVIKGIEKNYGRVPGIAAATILGDGSIALILDPANFVRSAAGRCTFSTGTLALAG